MRLVLALLLSLLVSCAAENLLECNIIGSKSPELRLKRHLFCEYDASIRPVSRKNSTVNVTVALMPTMMDFVDRSGLFVLHSWLFLHWEDEHLTWKSEDFEGVSVLHVSSSEIWVPDFSLYNTGEISSSEGGIPSTICQLYNSGRVVCVPGIKMSSLCETSYTYWPYDTQTCKLRLGSWAHTGEEINFEFRKQAAISMEHYVDNKEWLISNYSFKRLAPKYSCCPNDTFPTLYATFNLERHSPMLHSVYITPVVVLMVITLTVLWLDSRSIERISLSALNFICHILCIYDLHWMLPFNGANPPHILLFYRDSMALATFAMIVTTLLRKLQSTKAAAPSWIVSTVTLVANNRAGRFLLLDGAQEFDDSGRDVEENSEATLAETTGKLQADSWRKLSIIVEWLAFFIGLFAYIIMIFLLVPMSGYPTKTKFYEA